MYCYHSPCVIFVSERRDRKRKKRVDYKNFVYTYIKKMKTNSQTMGSCASQSYEVNSYVSLARLSMIVR